MDEMLKLAEIGVNKLFEIQRNAAECLDMSEKQFEGKSAIVTGGTRGIGKAIVTELARRGCNVAFNYSKSADEAESLKGEIEALGRKGFRRSMRRREHRGRRRVCRGR